MMNRFTFIDGIPKYQQIANQIKLEIVNVQIKPGDRLPTARELAVELKINIATVARSYFTLKKEGFLRVRRKAGSVVVMPPDYQRQMFSRSSRLAVMMDRVILEVLSQGYKPEELESLLRFQVERVNKMKIKPPV
jgi:GntR family transcriptional regulator